MVCDDSTLEAEIKDGGLKLCNVFLFDKSLKLGWLKQVKWKIFLYLEDFHELFNYGLDFIERMSEIIQIPFWNNVLDSLIILFRNNSIQICTTLWFNNI